MFELHAEAHPLYCPSASLYSWRSNLNGLEIVLVKCKTPVVNGYFTVATEINSDAGYPHTLEHLVFMGSQTHPYKGFLDVLGNKLMSNTNAWTGKDQTVYTLSTTGWEGFSHMLPVYLEHVLHPKITNSTCLTEVYHIDGDGQERGVVFSEMQGVENSPFSLIADELHKRVYGHKHPYASNTGGLLKALREIDADQISNYHKSLYSPQNLSVIITGAVETEDLLRVMTEFERKIGPVPSIPRPFSSVSTTSKIPRTEVHTIEFPESNEEYGEVQIGWHGTLATDTLGYYAIEALGYYLTVENNGKLQKELVEVDDPLCNMVALDTDDYKRLLVSISLSCVPTERLHEVDEAVMSVLRSAAQAENVDLDFMKDCVRRKRDKFVLNLESDPTNFAYMAIDNFLYGDSHTKSIKDWPNEISYFETLLAWTAQQWADFIHGHFVKEAHITVLGRPSRKLEKEVKSGKLKRQEEIKKQYDLEKLGREIAAAKEENEVAIPQELIDEVPAPDLNNINFIKTESAGVKVKGNGEVQKLISEDTPGNFALDLHFESFKSQFITTRVYMSSNIVDKDLLPYIDVILCEVFSMPMRLDDGTELSAEDVGLETSRDLLVSSISTNGMLQELVMFDLRFKKENYERAIQWLERAFFNVIFDHGRLSMFIKKYLAYVSEEVREGNSVMLASIHEFTLTSRSLRRESEVLVAEEFFKSVKDDIARVERDVKRLISQLVVPNNLRILISGGINDLEKPVSTWIPFNNRVCGSRSVKQELVPVPFSHWHRSELGHNPKHKAFLTFCPTDSCYMSIVTKGLTEYVHPDLPSLTLLNVFLGLTEGPMWREIRGEGLAYGARIYHRQELGLIICEFYSAADPIQAYKTTKKLVEDLAQGEHMFPDSEIKSSVLGFASALAADQATTNSAVIQKYFDSSLKNLGEDYIQQLIAKVAKVTKAELVTTLRKYILPLFHRDTSAVFNVSNESDEDALVQFFTSLGFEVETRHRGAGEDSDSDEEDSDLEFGSQESEVSEGESTDLGEQI